jgi:hypothetical protein
VATAIFGRLVRDDAVATLVFTNAGHLPPLVRHHDGTVDRIERGASPLIGVLEPGRRPRTASRGAQTIIDLRWLHNTE